MYKIHKNLGAERLTMVLLLYKVIKTRLFIHKMDSSMPSKDPLLSSNQINHIRVSRACDHGHRAFHLYLPTLPSPPTCHNPCQLFFCCCCKCKNRDLLSWKLGANMVSRSSISIFSLTLRYRQLMPYIITLFTLNQTAPGLI